MPYTESELQIEIDGLKTETRIAQANMTAFSERQFNGVRENTLIFCLSRATDTAKGCLLVAESQLAVSLGILTRGLLENLLWTYWVAQSNENAQTYQHLGTNELKRIVKKNLDKGYGTVIDKQTQQNRSQEFLQSPKMKSILRRKNIEDIAKETGLERLYTQMYGSMSMEVHGTTFGVWKEDEIGVKIFALLAAANSFMECINLIVKTWIIEQKLVNATDIYRTLLLQ